MSKKKGLSFDEKRQRIMDLFYEKKEFLQLKELEKIAPKEKGVISQSVKEVLQSLVDDGMVDSEKIGVFVCFWAFQSKAINARQTKLDDLDKEEKELEQKCAKLAEDIKVAQSAADDPAERAALVGAITSTERQLADMDKELDKLKDCDPDVLAAMEEEAKSARDAANRWTENVFSVRQWMRAKLRVEENDINKRFNIPENFDYLDSD